jgi:hypothetical protein
MLIFIKYDIFFIILNLNKLYIKINMALFKSGQKWLEIRDTDLGQ